MIVIDTDVLALFHFFTRDSRYDSTVSFMEETHSEIRGTTVYNLLELAGILSVAGKAELGRSLIEIYAAAADMEVLFPHLSPLSPEVFWADYTAELVDIISRGLRYGDAKVLWVAESNEVSCLVTWNTRHYNGMTTLRVLTPPEFLNGESESGGEDHHDLSTVA